MLIHCRLFQQTAPFSKTHNCLKIAVYMWDPTISVVSASISDASVSISPHFGTGFPEIGFVLSWQALPEKTGIPKLVSLAYCFWLKFVSSSSRIKNSTIDSLTSCFGRR
jgi:hypothetical protein